MNDLNRSVVMDQIKLPMPGTEIPDPFTSAVTERESSVTDALIALGWTPPPLTTPENIAARGTILSAGPQTLAGMPIIVDPDVPEGEVHLRHKDGRVDKIVLSKNIPPRPKK